MNLSQVPKKKVKEMKENDEEKERKINYIFPTLSPGRQSPKGTLMVSFIENEYGLHWKEAPISHIKRLIREVRSNDLNKEGKDTAILLTILLPTGEEITGYATFCL